MGAKEIMSSINKLYSLKQLEKFIATPDGFEIGGNLILAKQLADTMRELETLKIENDENCRLLGMSGSKELALITENERLRKAIDKWANAKNGM
jgi:hypothetical protein